MSIEEYMLDTGMNVDTMINEATVLNLVEEVTGGENTAHFENGTMFMNTGNSHVAITVFNAIFETITPCVSVVKVSASETAYDFF